MTPVVPAMRPLRSRKVGVSVVMVPVGSSGVGGSMTTGLTTRKLVTGDHGPVLAPSSARTRQKQVAPAPSRSVMV